MRKRIVLATSARLACSGSVADGSIEVIEGPDLANTNPFIGFPPPTNPGVFDSGLNTVYGSVTSQC